MHPFITYNRYRALTSKVAWSVAIEVALTAGQNITGSINLFSTISNAIETRVKVSLSEAAASAEVMVIIPTP